MSSTRAPRGKSYEELLRLRSQETDECILWPYGLNYFGYARLGSHVGATRAAHRISCELEYGPPPADQKYDAAHSCRNRACINPRHLRWATRAENMADKRRDGTDPVGERHGSAKITEDDVRTIRTLVASGVMQRTVAEQFNLSRASICLIVNKKNWSHVC